MSQCGFHYVSVRATLRPEFRSQKCINTNDNLIFIVIMLMRALGFMAGDPSEDKSQHRQKKCISLFLLDEILAHSKLLYCYLCL